MLQLEHASGRFPLDRPVTIGAGPGCDVVLEGEGILGRHLLLSPEPGGAVVVRPEPGAVATLNGVKLASEPTPVFHGDKVFVGGHELRVVQAERAGATRISTDAERLRAVPDATGTRAGASGGRIVSLTDGREYRIGGTPLVIGRDAGADVVLSDDDVSRIHAEIVAGPEGYRLVDRGANGTFVNGRRVPEALMLARGDVIRVGREEFRFSADGPVTPPRGAAMQLNDTLMGIPATPLPGALVAAQAPRLLGGLLVRSGERKGERLPLRTLVVNIGRAAYNDVVLPDPSVSTVHAKLQRREDLWIVADQGSTNGTFVDGERITEETVLAPGAALQFGEVKLLFDPSDAAGAPAGRDTREMVPALPGGPADRLPEEPAPPPRRPRGPPARRPAVEPPEQASARRWVIWVLILAALAATAALLLG
jgi:pSer/pThr/pTyr-binding forkhead associated (FHA) protein